MNLKDMAKAHLQNVNSKLIELQESKRVLEQEISKLESYIQEGLLLVNSDEQSSNV